MLWLNLGCGDFPAPPPWVNVDTTPDLNPDVVADLRHLPFPDGAAERVYCGHVLEHLPLEAVVPALREVARVLDPRGVLCVVGPDCDRALAFDRETAADCLWGGHRWPGDEHRWACTEERLVRLVTEAMLPAMMGYAVPIAQVPDHWPVVSRIGWQCAVIAAAVVPGRAMT
jgi:predicted SAM-dependent methyltransferase